jgi:hypothetical protein
MSKWKSPPDHKTGPTRTTQDTTWHEGKLEIIIPAGEPVKVVPYSEVPDADRSHLKRCVESYVELRGEFVPVLIRGWYAIMPTKQLEPIS